MFSRRSGFVDQRSENPAAVRRVADRRLSLLIDPGDDELRERAAGLVDHPERRVRGPGQLGCGFDDPLQDSVERQLRGERNARVDDCPQTIHLGHAARIIVRSRRRNLGGAPRTSRARGAWGLHAVVATPA
jgi:hypothetical protein